MVYGSLFQGGHDAHPVFCLIIAVVVIRAKGQLTLVGVAATFWVYVDDITFQCLLGCVWQVVEEVRKQLAVFRCELQTTKCKTYVPEARGVSSEQWPAELTTLQDHGLAVGTDGITLLGTDAAAQFALELDQGRQAVPTSTASRADKAVVLACACKQLAGGAPAAGGRHAAWAITRSVVCHALDYDMRVLPSSNLLPHAHAVAEAAWSVAEAVVGSPLDENQREQMWLPADLGGCAWHDVVGTAPLARAADIIEQGPRLRAALRARRPGATDEEIAGLEDAEEMKAAAAAVALMGVFPGPQGLPSGVAAKDPMRSPCPARHLLSAYLRRVAEQRQEHLLLRLPRAGKVRLLSCGGKTSGQSLVAPLATPGVAFNDNQIRRALRWRLGVLDAAGVCRCTPVAGGDHCGAAVGPNGEHAMSCMIGPCRYAVHGELSDCMCAFAEEAGARSRREVFVPEFIGKTPPKYAPKQNSGHEACDEDDEKRQAAILDVWACGARAVEDLLLDITVRNPTADRYVHKACGQAGWAASVAEEAKQKRYPPAAGRAVQTVAVEAYGRLGSQGEAVLASLACDAAEKDARSGRTSRGRLQ